LRPALGAGPDVDQLHAHPQAVPRPAHGALQHVRDAQLPADLAHVEVAAALERERRRACRDAQSGHLPQGIGQLVGHAVGEELLGRVAADVQQRQDGDRLLAGGDGRVGRTSTAPPPSCHGDQRQRHDHGTEAPAPVWRRGDGHRAGRARRRRRECPATGEAIGRRLGEGAQHGVVERRGELRPGGTHAAWRLAHQARDHHLGGGAGVRWLPGEHLVGQRTEGVLVGPGVDGAVAGGLLGTHVVRGAEREASLGDAAATSLCHREGDPEIGDDRLTGLEQDVLGLEVAVHHAASVGEVERAGEEREQTQGLVEGQLLLAREPGPQRLALDVGHHVVEQAVGRPGVEEREQVGMLQVRGGPDLAQEPLGADDGGELGAQHLDGDLAVVLEVVGEVDGGHAAGTEFALEPVAVGEGRAQAFQVAHRAFPLGRPRRCTSAAKRGSACSTSNSGQKLSPDTSTVRSSAARWIHSNA
jgi:hypothetical protein